MKEILHYETITSTQHDDWIVFLHGAGGSIATWKAQKEYFQSSFNVLLIDLRDHGASKDIAPEATSYHFDLIVDDVMKVCRAEHISQAHFVSLSFGSVVIQAIYKKHPNIVKSLVAIGAVFNATWLLKSFVHSARFCNLFLSYRAMYKTFSYLLMPRKNHAVARRVYQMQARKLTQSEYIKWLGLYSEFFSLLGHFQNQPISCPLLIIMGSEDYLFLPGAKKFASEHAIADLKIIDHTGHICNIENPETTNETIAAFL